MAHQVLSAERLEYLRKVMKEARGWTDEEINSLSSKQWTRLDRSGKFRDYDIVAEVVEVNRCAFKPQKGDRFVFRAGILLVPEESTFPALCLWAMARIVPFTFMIMDRISIGVDPNDNFFDHVKCCDTGLQCGGLGEVLFRVYAEKVPAEKRFFLPGELE